MGLEVCLCCISVAGSLALLSSFTSIKTHTQAHTACTHTYKRKKMTQCTRIFDLMGGFFFSYQLMNVAVSFKIRACHVTLPDFAWFNSVLSADPRQIIQVDRDIVSHP